MKLFAELIDGSRKIAEQNAFAAEEKNCRHEEWVKQIQEETDDMNMQRNTSDYTSMNKAYFDRKRREIMTRQQLFTSDYTPTMADDEGPEGEPSDPPRKPSPIE
ncbi:hypothetical protein DVH24_024018 [Malus domestica]|uniref:No apical meristem-associated C-terminal domain-containing protein n=1 Tax=Malus domestica TaxID=3750 RepID=A0A498JK72_MALDO|nr:hypothetical protein DVH24_024018 [Malus domestica]